MSQLNTINNETYLNRPYWWDDAGFADTRLERELELLPDTIETLIVGAGYSGLSAALTLARAGRDVTLIDSEQIGHGCSSRNGGHIGPSFHKLGMAGLTRAFGSLKAVEILRESMDSLTYLKSLIKKEQIECDLKPEAGRFKGAGRIAHYDEMAKAHEDLAKAVGFRFKMVSKSEQSKHIGSNFYHGGVFHPDDGALQPAKFVIGLAQKAITAGVKIYAPARATAVQRDGSGFRVQIASKNIIKPVTAKQVLIATNGYSGPELGYFHRRIIPLRSAIIATEQLPKDMIATAFPTGNCIIESSRLSLYYRPSPDGTRVIFGGRAFNRNDLPQNYVPDLRRLMIRIFPQLSEAAITHAWSGTVAYTFDHAPHLGVHEGIHHVMGYCGSGVGRATYFGHKAGLKMLGQRDGKTSLDGLTFSTRPLYRGNPWFLPAVLRWHSLMDRFGH